MLTFKQQSLFHSSEAWVSQVFLPLLLSHPLPLKVVLQIMSQTFLLQLHCFVIFFFALWWFQLFFLYFKFSDSFVKLSMKFPPFFASSFSFLFYYSLWIKHRKLHWTGLCTKKKEWKESLVVNFQKQFMIIQTKPILDIS